VHSFSQAVVQLSVTVSVQLFEHVSVYSVAQLTVCGVHSAEQSVSKEQLPDSCVVVAWATDEAVRAAPNDAAATRTE
jgi:hypothetical protein